MSAVWVCTNPLCDCGTMRDDGVGVKSFFNIEKLRIEYSPICRGCGAAVGPEVIFNLAKAREQRAEGEPVRLDV